MQGQSARAQRRVQALMLTTAALHCHGALCCENEDFLLCAKQRFGRRVGERYYFGRKLFRLVLFRLVLQLVS